MAQKYILLKTNDSSDGMIAINKSVFYSIAELSIDEVEDAVRIPKTKFNKPLKVTIADNKLGLADRYFGNQLIHTVSVAPLLSEPVLHADQAKENDATLIR